MRSRASVFRWSALRDKKAALKEVTESFLVHRHDLSQATQANYRLQFRLYDGWVAAQLGRPTRVGDVEPGTVNAYLEHRRTTVSAQSAHAAWKALRSLATFLAARRILREGDNDPDASLFTDRSGQALTGNAVRKLFDRLKVSTGIDDLCAHMLRHTWATNYHRSASGSRFDLQTEGGWRTGRMVERYTKSRPFEERRRGPSPLTA